MKQSRESQIHRREEAAYAYCGGEFDVAAKLYAELLEEGCVEAAIGLAHMYLRGEGVVADVERGLALMRQAAAAGISAAAFNLGALHRSGDCHVPVNAEESRRYFLLARELGCPLRVEDYLR